ncbi:uncharacterized protein LOC142329486 [Lycorma delicatula]|uniref:uncharacterized protein LOC142329486 n=1 Tax=Lycorma delicatula TaxID=130591 RepID=UPI003F5100B4
MGNSVLNYEELSTLLIQKEACLNSRPLYLPSSDTSDPASLTPGHFLIFAPLTSLPDPNFSNTNVNKLARWQLIQKLLKDFWKAWSNDYYLHSLQQRNKYKISNTNICVGNVVIIKENKLPPLIWKLGIIVQVHPGKDGHVRLVNVKTNNTIIKRTINKLIVLPNLNDCDA